MIGGHSAGEVIRLYAEGRLEIRGRSVHIKESRLT